MRELIYTVLELEKEYKNRNCEFCSNRRIKTNKAVKEIITRHEATDELIAVDVICGECEEKYWNNQILKCDKCGRLQTRLDFDFFSGKYVCYCVRNNENLEEKELPSLPHEGENMTSFYERQINVLREEKVTAENIIKEEREAHEDFMRISEEWGKRQKQELLDRIRELEAEVKRLKKQTPQELLDEISKLKERVKELEEQTAQIEVKETKKWPWRLKK